MNGGNATHRHIAGRGGLVVARLPAVREVLGSNRAAGKSLCFSRKSLQYPAFRTLTAVQRSTQPSALQGTVNAYQPNGWVIIPVAMGECSAYGSLQADSKVKFAAWPTSWRSPGIDRLSSRWTKVNSRIRLALYRHHYKYHPGYYYYYYYYLLLLFITVHMRLGAEVGSV